jgi:hypothetical protein
MEVQKRKEKEKKRVTRVTTLVAVLVERCPGMSFSGKVSIEVSNILRIPRNYYTRINWTYLKI